jgi:hypothetical protein
MGKWYGENFLFNMMKLLTLYGTAALFYLAAIWLIRNGLKKEDVKTKMQMVNYRPTFRHYGKGHSIALGILCLVCGSMLIYLSFKK